MWGRAGAHSGSASVVSAFSSPLLAPGFAWRPSFRGRRCYTHLPPGGLALGVIPTGVRLFFFGGGRGGGSGSPRCFFFPVSFLSITSFFLFGFFYAYGSKKKRNFVVCAAGAGSVDIPYFDSHLHCCGVSVPGEARLRGGLRRSQNAEKLQAWAEARAAVSLIGLLAV